MVVSSLAEIWANDLSDLHRIRFVAVSLLDNALSFDGWFGWFLVHEGCGAARSYAHFAECMATSPRRRIGPGTNAR